MSDRITLNAHEDITNIVDRKHMVNIIEQTMCQFTDKLTTVCGPYARNALILSLQAGSASFVATGSNVDSKIYMRDGSHVIGNIEYLSPIQQYLKSIVSYVGTRVDAACGDGTTTAMLFASYLLQELCTDAVHQTCAMVSTTQFEQDCKDVFTAALTNLEYHKITIDDIATKYNCTINEAAMVLSYLQAYTSSNADCEVAVAVSTFFKHMPRESWKDSITNNVPASETTDYRVKAEFATSEVYLDCNFLTSHMFNFERRRYYKMDAVDLLILRNGLVDFSIETMLVLNYLKESDRPIFILVPGGNNLGSGILNEINELTLSKKKSIAVGSYQLPIRSKIPVVWAIDGIIAKANKPVFDSGKTVEECVIKDTKIFLDNKYCFIDNITPYDDRLNVSDNRHPGEVFPDDYQHYTDTKEFFLKQLELKERNHNKDFDEIADLRKGLSEMSTKYKIQLKLGGYSHELQALMPVIEDATKGSLTAVVDGMYLNGIYRLYSCFKTVMDEKTKIGTPTQAIIAHACTEALKRCALATYGNAGCNDVDTFFSNIDQVCRDKYAYIDITENPQQVHSFDQIVEIILTDTTPDLFVAQNYMRDHSYPPIQAAKLYPELLGRINEVVSKLAVTDLIVVPGTLWNTDLDKVKR